MRIGFGFDVHQLEAGRDFWLGGIKIAHPKGATGHSDADVMIHAICDALLGAANLGDIGKHFPDTSSDYKNIDSKILLAKTFELIKAEGYSIVNIDTMLCLELPKIKPYIPAMKQRIASILEVKENDVSIKATTTEKMGFVGREEGLMAYATVLIQCV